MRRTPRLFVPLVLVMLLAACGNSGGNANSASTAASASSSTQSAGTGSSPSQLADEPTLEDLYQEALKEGGEITWYEAMPADQAAEFLPIFEKRFPGMKVQQVDLTADEAVAREIAEKRAGRVVADVTSGTIGSLIEGERQGVYLKYSPPEAAAMPEGFKGPDWTARDVQSLIIAWNTNLVPEAEAPRTYADLTDPKWKDAIVGEPRDYNILLGLANKFDGDHKQAEDLIRKIAANNPRFVNGHSSLADLLTAGQAKVCFSCYAHHYPPRIAKGAPVDYSLDEGVANIVFAAVLDGAPHPNSAKLFLRWQLSEEGQQAAAKVGLTPALPSVEPIEAVRADPLYPVSPEDYVKWPEAKDLWEEIFALR